MKNILPKESRTVEWETSFNDEVVHSLVAFSNSEGGTVFVGVADDGKITGVEVGRETLVHWVNEVRNKTAPSVVPDVEAMEIDGKTVAGSLF